jgi:hypothetical protein
MSFIIALDGYFSFDVFTIILQCKNKEKPWNE